MAKSSAREPRQKSSAGYDLTRLLVGSEGTLGVITEVGLQALRHSGIHDGGRVPISERRGGLQGDHLTIQIGIPVARIELVDEEHVKALNVYSKLDLKIAPTLFVEFHGTVA